MRHIQKKNTISKIKELHKVVFLSSVLCMYTAGGRSLKYDVPLLDYLFLYSILPVNFRYLF